MEQGLPECITRLVESVVQGSGESSSELRERVFSVASSLSNGSSAGGLEPEELGRLIHKMSKHAYRIVDEDLDALRHRGFSDNTVIVAAVAAGHVRLLKGIEALEETLV